MSSGAPGRLPALPTTPLGSPAVQDKPALLLQGLSLPWRPENGLQAELGGEVPPALCAQDEKRMLVMGHRHPSTQRGCKRAEQGLWRREWSDRKREEWMEKVDLNLILGRNSPGRVLRP